MSQALYDYAVMQKKQVDPWQLTKASGKLYRSTKVIGINNTDVMYIDSNGKQVCQKANLIPDRMRAVAGFVETLLYRWNDQNTRRLEKHLALNMPIHLILEDTKIFNNNHAGMGIITVADLVKDDTTTRTIDLQALYDYAIIEEKVDPWQLKKAAEELYQCVKVIGINNTNVTYIDSNGKRVCQKANLIPDRMRAVAGFVETLLYRWNDQNTRRLEKHLALNMPIHLILEDTKIFNNNHAGMGIITVANLVNVSAIMPRKINLQVLYDCAIMRKKVDPWQLTEAADGIYQCAKVIGLDYTDVMYIDSNGNQVCQKANMIPDRMRAIAAFIETLLYRWNDQNTHRLEEHFNLSMPIHLLLEDTEIFNNNHAGMDIITVADFINANTHRNLT